MVIVIVLLLVLLGLCILRQRQQAAQIQKMRHNEEVKHTFFQSLSHDIRTPLHTVSGLAGVIAEDKLYLSKSEKRNIADQIKYNTNIITTLLDEFTVFFNEEKGGHAIEMEELSPNIVCQRCLESNVSQNKDLRCHFRRELNDEFFIHTDSHLLELILNKFIKNAYRFTEKGEIVIGCNTSETPGCLTIYVENTGATIPEDRRPFLFTWFEHPEDMKDTAELDLSVAQYLADKLHGIIRLDEHYQQGTRLTLVLPIN